MGWEDNLRLFSGHDQRILSIWHVTIAVLRNTRVFPHTRARYRELYLAGDANDDFASHA